MFYCANCENLVPESWRIPETNTCCDLYPRVYVEED